MILESHEFDIGPEVDELFVVDFEWQLSLIDMFCWFSACCICKWLARICCWCWCWSWFTMAAFSMRIGAIICIFPSSWFVDMWLLLFWLDMSTNFWTLISLYCSVDFCCAFVWLCAFDSLVVPLIAAIGFGMFVVTTDGILDNCCCCGVAVELVCALTVGGGICELLALLSGRFCSVKDLRLDDINFNLLSFLLDDDFCAFGTAILLSLISADWRAGLLSFFSDFFVSVSLLELFDDDNSNFDLVFDANVSDDFLLVSLVGGGGWLTGIPDVFVVWSLFKLKLESLRSLRADEKPLLELVRFDICVFDERSDFSLLNNFNLSNIECLVGVAGAPFITILPLPPMWFCTAYGLAGILHTVCCRKLEFRTNTQKEKERRKNENDKMQQTENEINFRVCIMNLKVTKKKRLNVYNLIN